jgi:hypothetical protein
MCMIEYKHVSSELYISDPSELWYSSDSRTCYIVRILLYHKIHRIFQNYKTEPWFTILCTKIHKHAPNTLLSSLPLSHNVAMLRSQNATRVNPARISNPITTMPSPTISPLTPQKPAQHTHHTHQAITNPEPITPTQPRLIPNLTQCTKPAPTTPKRRYLTRQACRQACHTPINKYTHPLDEHVQNKVRWREFKKFVRLGITPMPGEKGVPNGKKLSRREREEVGRDVQGWLTRGNAESVTMRGWREQIRRCYVGSSGTQGL